MYTTVSLLALFVYLAQREVFCLLLSFWKVMACIEYRGISGVGRSLWEVMAD
jgi:hypothetical protein